MNLTDEQDAVVKAINGSYLVLAGPGSGKTHTIIEKIIYLFDKEIIPEPFGLLAITFTNTAANEMKSRLQSRGFNAWDRVFIGTFHSFCRYLLTCYGSDVGIREDFDIADKSVQGEIFNKLIQNRIGLNAANLLTTIDKLKRRGIYPGSGDEKIDAQLMDIYKSYQDSLLELNLVDYNDLIYYALRLIENSTIVARVFLCFYRYVVVDEFQDTDPTQLQLVYLLSKCAQGVTIVADDDQSVFGWRGAKRQNVYEIAHLIQAETLQLGVNFRSDQVIVEAANKVIQLTCLSFYTQLE